MQMTEYLAGMEPFGTDEPGCRCCEVTARGQEAFDAIADALQLKHKAVDLNALKEKEQQRLVEIAQIHKGT
eukprot:symbB.v1.2.000815.t1/scaffold44.1/size390916/28